MTISAFIVRVWMGYEDEEVGGMVRVLQEGLGPSIACFLLAWITSYTVMHT